MRNLKPKWWPSGPTVCRQPWPRWEHPLGNGDGGGVGTQSGDWSHFPWHIVVGKAEGANPAAFYNSWGFVGFHLWEVTKVSKANSLERLSKEEYVEEHLFKGIWE